VVGNVAVPLWLKLWEWQQDKVKPKAIPDPAWHTKYRIDGEVDSPSMPFLGTGNSAARSFLPG
jgi:hypothetical protein